MEYVYICFKSRQDANFIADVLQKKGVNCEIVSTPAVFNIGCGLSVKLSKVYGNFAKRVISIYNPKSFVATFLYVTMGKKSTFKRI